MRDKILVGAGTDTVNPPILDLVSRNAVVAKHLSANVTSDAKIFCEEDIPVGTCESRGRLLDHNRVVRQAQIAPTVCCYPLAALQAHQTCERHSC